MLRKDMDCKKSLSAVAQRMFLAVGLGGLTSFITSKNLQDITLTVGNRPAAYGIANVAETDTNALSDSIARTLKYYSLSGVNLDLFPNDPKDVDGATSIIDGTNNYNVVGMSYGEKTADVWAQSVTNWKHGDDSYTKSDLSNAKINFLRELPGVRVFISLHESAHFVAAKTGFASYVQKLLSSQLDRPLSHLELENMHERIADTATALYLLSNYKDGKRYIDDFIEYHNSQLDAVHYTASSLKNAVEEFHSKPRYAMDIYESTFLASKIVSKQISSIQEVSIVDYVSSDNINLYNVMNSLVQRHLPPGDKTQWGILERSRVARTLLSQPH